jgi:hypothetical protein
MRDNDNQPIKGLLFGLLLVAPFWILVSLLTWWIIES